MKAILDTCWKQVEIVFEGMQTHFKEYPASRIFLGFIIVVLILNIARRLLIWLEKKRGTPNQACRYLFTVGDEQDCSHLSYRKRFRENGNDCEKCRDKMSQMTDAEAELRILSGHILVSWIVRLANGSRGILPYMSFAYTLILAIFTNK